MRVPQVLQVAVLSFCFGFGVVYLVIIRDILLGTPPACNGLLCELLGLSTSSSLYDGRVVIVAVALLVCAPLLLFRWVCGVAGFCALPLLLMWVCCSVVVVMVCQLSWYVVDNIHHRIQQQYVGNTSYSSIQITGRGLALVHPCSRVCIHVKLTGKTGWMNSNIQVLLHRQRVNLHTCQS